MHKGDNRWKGHGCIININSEKFHDFAPGVNSGGGGAIDLVMHVNSCNFKQSIAWLNDRFGEEGMQRAVAHRAKIQANVDVKLQRSPQFVKPRDDVSQWNAVYNYLTIKRGLPPNLVNALHEQGIVYADEHQNAVFAMRSFSGVDRSKQLQSVKNASNSTVGAFLRGTRGENNSFMGYAIGTKRSQGSFYVDLGGQVGDEIQRVVLCKSPIDALSYLTLEQTALEKAPQQKTIYLVSDSTRNLPVTKLKDIPEVIAAYDKDSAGNQLSRDIQKLLPQTTIKQPIEKDWNQQLLEMIRRLRLEREAKQEKKTKNKGLEL
ncbi:MAG: DUF3991 and TOPRIM domain-containing protein [Cyanobacteria bacterium J06629_18]